MNAGLPGTGIGGLFYIASALLMPVHRTLRGYGHEGRSWRRVCAQGLIAGGILWGLAATGSMLDHMVAPMISAMPGGGARAAQQVEGLVRWWALIGTAGLLTLVLLTVELARLTLGRRAVQVRPRANRLRSYQRSRLNAA